MSITTFSYLAEYIPFRKELKLRIEGDIGIVSNKQDYQVDYFNETALRIFLLIDGKKNVADILECFMKDFDVSRDIFEQDLIEILRGFQWKKLIALQKNQ